MFWLCFATGCRFGSLVWQARSAGRNLITLFFTVNNPREKNSHGHPSTPPAKTLRERPPTPRRRSLSACTHPRKRRCVGRKTLKRSTFAFRTAAAPALALATSTCAGGIATASRTGTKQGRKLFTSANAFCARICRTAQTFGRRSAAGSCRFRASMTRSMGGRRASMRPATRAHDQRVGMPARSGMSTAATVRTRRPPGHPSRTDNALDVGKRTMPRAGKKKRPHRAAAFSWQARISGPRLPALRRSRPDPAVRSTLPCWTARSRRSSLRRRRLR